MAKGFDDHLFPFCVGQGISNFIDVKYYQINCHFMWVFLFLFCFSYYVADLSDMIHWGDIITTYRNDSIITDTLKNGMLGTVFSKNKCSSEGELYRTFIVKFHRFVLFKFISVKNV